MYYFATYWTFPLNVGAKGALKRVPFTYQNILGVKVHFKAYDIVLLHAFMVGNGI